MASKSITRPEDLASQIGVSGKVVRGFLRREFKRPASAKGSTWILTPAQVKATRAHFKSLQASDTRVTKAKARNASQKPARKSVTPRKAKATPKAPQNTPKADTPQA